MYNITKYSYAKAKDSKVLGSAGYYSLNILW